MINKIRIIGIEGALKNYKKNFGGSEKKPWYANRINEIFTIDTKFKDAYYVKEYSGSVIKEDAEIIKEF